MKKLATYVVAAAALIGTPAFAADMAVKAPPPPPRVPVYSWSGCYLGGNIGGIWEHDTTSIGFDDPINAIVAPAFTGGAAPTSFAYDRGSVLGGGQLGCNYQVTKWVVGIETDFDWTDLQGQKTVTLAPPHFFALTSGVIQKTDWIGTTRGRFGAVISDNILLYGTAGVAYAHVSESYLFNNVAGGGPLATFGTDSTTRFGWTAGGGLEIGFGAWSVKGEALYYDVGSHTLSIPCTVSTGATCASIVIVPPNPPNATLLPRFENQGVIVRVGLNYQFH